MILFVGYQNTRDQHGYYDCVWALLEPVFGYQRLHARHQQTYIAIRTAGLWNERKYIRVNIQIVVKPWVWFDIKVLCAIEYWIKIFSVHVRYAWSVPGDGDDVWRHISPRAVAKRSATYGHQLYVELLQKTRRTNHIQSWCEYACAILVWCLHWYVSSKNLLPPTIAIF